MMLDPRGSLHMLAGGLRVKARVQHPQVKPRKDRPGSPWVFRYWADEIQVGGSMKTLRKYQEIAPSKGDGAITKKQAEIEHYKYERRILSFDETARVLARLEDTVRLIVEICIATGARISEVLAVRST